MSEQGMNMDEPIYAKPQVLEPDAAEKRPRVALMGEFSAGKSTLSNLLVGQSALPVNVTATQLPPVWMSYGQAPAYRVGLGGEEEEVPSDFSGVSVNDTRCVRVFMESTFLKNCDLIDMPGISDPNMDAAVWQRVIGEADIVIWCSHATQAWRQSEAAVWGTMPEGLYDKSLLLLTRMDRILSDRDRARVVKRVQSETKGLFREVLPVSLIQAIEAKGDADAWATSGADHLVKSLMELTDEVATGTIGRRVSRKITPETARQPSRSLDDAIGERIVERPAKVVMPTRVRPRPLISRPPNRH
ncbi:MAG: dynamin family protein [Pseudomonadota bacterium]